MKRLGLLLSASTLLLACQEVIVVHDSSVTREFSRMNREGWQVTRNDQPIPSRSADNTDPNVRVIREADFSGYRFNTNFQINDPRYPQSRNQPPLPGTPDTPPGTTGTAPAPDTQPAAPPFPYTRFPGF